MKRKLKLGIDACMTLLMVGEMAYPATGSAFHEWAGMALFGLFITHHLLNGAWHRRIFQGRYSLTRSIMAALDMALTLLMLIELVTSSRISEKLFPTTGLSSGMEARQLHTFAAYWGLLLMGAHLGLHWGVVLSAVRKSLPQVKTPALCARAAALALAVLGACAFGRLEVGAKLTMYYTFSYFDPDTGVLRYLLGFFFLMCGAAVWGYYGMKAALHKQRKRKTQTTGKSQEGKHMAKVLTLYYSRKGENYVDGGVQSLQKGNTEIVAEFVQKAVGGELFELETVKDYPANYTACTREAQAELRQNARPELKRMLGSIAGYDTIVVCGPCWWGTYPMAVLTQLEALDFAGKKVLAVMTHEGSGLGSCERDLKRSCKGADVGRGLAVHGAEAAQSEKAVSKWAAQNI